jgi:endonuclease/exonuclease/phosphatase family metal-dependent hydrolase
MSKSARSTFVVGWIPVAMTILLTGCTEHAERTSTIRLMGILPAGTGAPIQRVPRSPAARAPAPRGLGVMTVNLEHRDKPEQLKTVAEHLKAEPAGAPDFIFCQEVVFGRGGKENSTAAVLADYLGYHVRGTKRTSDHEGIAIVSKYPIEFYDSINLKSQTSRFILGFRRVSTMAETTVPGIGRVRLVNLHLTNWGFERRVRTNQLRETLQWAAAREKKAPAAITFLAGDFNADPNTDEMKLVKDQTLTGPLAFKDWNTTTPSKGPNGDPDRRIDYIFVSARPAVSLKSERLMWKDGVPTGGGGKFYLSDHLALVHRYNVAPTGVAPTPPREVPEVITGIEANTPR